MRLCEKGTNVTLIICLAVGFLAVGRRVVCARGVVFGRRGGWAAAPGAPRSRARRSVCVVLAAGVVLAVGTAPAFASAGSSSQSAGVFGSLTAATPATGFAEPPHIEGRLIEETVHATRAHIDAFVCPETTEFEFKGEYAESPDGPWTSADGGPVRGESNTLRCYEVSLGEAGPATGPGVVPSLRQRELRHLKSDATYYARFYVENSNGAIAERTFEFKTTDATEPPEVNNASEYLADGDMEFFQGEGGSVTGTRTSLNVIDSIESNGVETDYSFEYSRSAAGPWTLAASGAIAPAQEVASPEVQITGLAVGTKYYVRVKAKNAYGAAEGTQELSTETGMPQPSVIEIRNVTGSSAHVAVSVSPDGSATSWRLESASAEGGPFTEVPGGGGTISQAEAEAVGENVGVDTVVPLTGLQPRSKYVVRVVGENKCAEGCGRVTGASRSFETEGPPIATTFATHGLHGEAVRLMGAVNPKSEPTSSEQVITIGGAPTGGSFTLSFEGHSTAPLPDDANREEVQSALVNLPAEPNVQVYGPMGGPYTVYFSDGGVAEPRIVGEGSGLTPAGTVSVATVVEGGVGYETSYRYEYVAEAQYSAPGGEGGYARATATREVNVGSGDTTKFAAVDLPALQAGETYHYRLVATGTAPGEPVVYGADQTLSVPLPAPVQAKGACPNAAFRIGPGARLPDCRAYEQVTPVDKEGSAEPFKYSGGVLPLVLVGEDGEHALVENPDVNWGSGPSAGQSPYVFTREVSAGSADWRFQAAAAQPQTGVKNLLPLIFSSDLTQIGFSSGTQTSVDTESPLVEYLVGPAGGPYTTAATVPRAQIGAGWVAATADFSKLILSVDDYDLLGSPTGTKQGEDLYEYAGGRLRQLNVDSEGATLGQCGAVIDGGTVLGGESSLYQQAGTNRYTVSEDGERVFFEAVPSANCAAERHLYMRDTGRETVDIGAYRFRAANPEGTKVLLERPGPSAREVFLYEPESGAPPALLFTVPGSNEVAALLIAKSFDALYFETPDQLAGTEAPALSPELEREEKAGELSTANVKNIYRYDLPSKKLEFVAQAANEYDFQDKFTLTPDGRYLYFSANTVGGLPGGALDHDGGLLFGVCCETQVMHSDQIYRYDSVQRTVQCVSCASPSDPEPRGSSSFGSGPTSGNGLSLDPGYPDFSAVTADGSRAFFETTAALVPGDVDGERFPEDVAGSEFLTQRNWSPSTDVYEWRRQGLEGCTAAQGCLALISSGTGSFLTFFIGIADEGRDVFFYTGSQLVPADQDKAGDIYDARVDGGQAPPAPRPTECEGDACSTPPAAPNDATPASATFTGAGNVTAAPSSKPAVRSGKSKKKPKPKKKPRRVKGKRRAKAKRTSDGRGARR